MPKHIHLEVSPLEKPILLLIDTNTGQNNQILNLLVDKFHSQVETYVLSKKHISQNASKISPLGIHLLDKIREPISYAVLFLDSEKEKPNVLSAIDKLDSSNTRTLLLVPVRLKASFVDVLLDVKSKKNVIVLFVGDVFGNRFKQGTLSKTIIDSLRLQEITVAGSGLVPIFPISDLDLEDAIMHIMLGVKSPAPFYNAYYRNPQTFLSLAHHLKRHEPELSISFEYQDTASYEFEKNERVLQERMGVTPEYIKPQLGFDKSIEYLSYEKKEIEKTKKTKRKKSHKKKVLKYAKTIGLRFLIALLLYGIVSLGFIAVSVLFLRDGVRNFALGNTQSAVQKFEISSTFYNLSLPTVMVLMHTPGNSYTDPLLEYIHAYDAIQENLLPIVNVLDEYNKNGILAASLVQQLQNILFDSYFLTQRFAIPEFKNMLQSSYFKDVSSFLTLLPLIPHIAGFEGEKSYVLLLQNNNELRPTGGFIGSVGYLTVENGKIKSLLIEDVYDLDGQLKGHIEPHYVIRRNLQPSLYLRDSNFNPDFDMSASTSAVIYNIESKRQVDGIVTLDTEVLKKLIEIAGPITLEGQGSPLQAENAASLLHQSIHDDYFEGSTEKKQLLSELVKKLIVIFESDSYKRIALMQALPGLIKSKHILFSFPSKSLQQAFISAGFAGSLKDTRLPVYDIPDFLSINEANISVNKVNEFVTRKITYSANLDQKILYSDAFLELTNKGGEDYRSYIRFIIPQNAQVTNIEINGQVQQMVPAVTNPILFERQAFVAPAGLEVDSEIQDGYKMVGFVVNVPVDTTSRIHVLYSTQYDISEGNLSYSLLYVKQPGTLPYPLIISLETNGKYKNKKTPSAVILNEDIAGDTEIVAELER